MDIPLLIINDTGTTDYSPRLTVKGVIMNEQNQVLLFSNLLPGGGAEEGENFEEALKRECLEEIGAIIEITESLGTVIQYRDFIQKKYEIHGYLCSLISITEPTTSQEDEVGKKYAWLSIDEAINLMEGRIEELAKEIGGAVDDTPQSRLFNSQTTLAFLKKAKEMI